MSEGLSKANHDKYINRVQESFANMNYFAHPPMIPHTKKRDNDDAVMMPPTVSNSPIFIPPPIAKTQDSTLSNSSQPRTVIKVGSPTPQQSDDLQFKVDHLVQYLKTQKAPPWTMHFGSPVHFRMAQDNRELSGNTGTTWWKD